MKENVDEMEMQMRETDGDFDRENESFRWTFE
jgi:hypothetical protein